MSTMTNFRPGTRVEVKRDGSTEFGRVTDVSLDQVIVDLDSGSLVMVPTTLVSALTTGWHNPSTS